MTWWGSAAEVQNEGSGSPYCGCLGSYSAVTPNFALKLQCVFLPDNNFVLGGAGVQEESWLILVQILHVVLQLVVWSQMGSVPGVPDSTVDNTHFVPHNENPSFPEAGGFLSPFTSSLLSLQINYTTCCRVCG